MGRRDGEGLALAAAVTAAVLVALVSASPLPDEFRQDTARAQIGSSRGIRIGLAPIVRQHARNSTAATQGPTQAPATNAVSPTVTQTDKARLAGTGSTSATRSSPSNSTAEESMVEPSPAVNSTASKAPAGQGSQLVNTTSDGPSVAESPIASPAQMGGQNGSLSNPRKESRGPVIRNVSVLVAIIFAAIGIAAVPLACCFFCGCCTIEKKPKEMDDFESADSKMLEKQKRLSRSSVRKSLDCSSALGINGIPKSVGHTSETDDFSLSSDCTDSRSGSRQSN
jgi:hypothetical protein